MRTFLIILSVFVILFGVFLINSFNPQHWQFYVGSAIIIVGGVFAVVLTLQEIE